MKEIRRKINYLECLTMFPVLSATAAPKTCIIEPLKFVSVLKN
jgi:hypothetical protein